MPTMTLPIATNVCHPVVRHAVVRQPTWVRSLSADEALGIGYTTAAIRTVSEVAEDLAINPETLSVTLYARCSPNHPDASQHPAWIDGFVNNGEGVFLAAGLGAARLMEVAAHEVRHVWQIRQGWQMFRSRQFLEQDADSFGRDWAQRMLRAKWVEQMPGEPIPRVFA